MGACLCPGNPGRRTEDVERVIIRQELPAARRRAMQRHTVDFLVLSAAAADARRATAPARGTRSCVAAPCGGGCPSAAAAVASRGLTREAFFSCAHVHEDDSPSEAPATESEPEKEALPLPASALRTLPSLRALPSLRGLPSVQARLAGAGHPDFSGSWLCTSIEGDWNAYLKETGVSWSVRTAIASLGYGVGLQMEDISQTDEYIEVVNVIKFPHKEAKTTYQIDGQPEVIADFEGKLMVSTTCWEGDVLVTMQHLEDPWQPLPTARRFMCGEQMCTERSTPAGLAVKRFYNRT